jgi:hypothetical protein
MVLMTHNTDVADSWEREGEIGFFCSSRPTDTRWAWMLLHAKRTDAETGNKLETRN